MLFSLKRRWQLARAKVKLDRILAMLSTDQATNTVERLYFNGDTLTIILNDASGTVTQDVRAAIPSATVIRTAHSALSPAPKKPSTAGHSPLTPALENGTTETPATRPNLLAQSRSEPGPKIELPTIKHIIAVASGKGGVGKSTVAYHLARALQRQGLKTGLLDLDIYGPSLPLLLNRQGERAKVEDKQFLPIIDKGLITMSLGFVTDPDKATIWRGPMVMGAVQQLLKDTRWPELDVLVLDLPPGTGDAQLTLAQKVHLTGALIVTTPHGLSLLDARKGLQMFQKMSVPVWGIVENMASYQCAHCGANNHPFGDGVIESDVPVIAKIPLVANLELQHAVFDGLAASCNEKLT